MKPKKMVYGWRHKDQVLWEGKHKGVHIVIKSYGTHPCIYLGVHPWSIKAHIHYDHVPISVHGGMTFNGRDERIDKFTYWYGWDYAHAGDFTGHCLVPVLKKKFYRFHLDALRKGDERKYTTEQLEEEAITAAEEFSKLTYWDFIKAHKRSIQDIPFRIKTSRLMYKLRKTKPQDLKKVLNKIIGIKEDEE